MFSRHLIAAAAMAAATFSAHADVISTSPDALASSSVIANATVSSSSGMASNLNIVDSGASGDLAAMLATSTSSAQLYLVRGVEGLYMLASRFIPQADAVDSGTAAVVPVISPDVIAAAPSSADATAPAAADATAPVTAPADALVPVTNADDTGPIVTAADVPEPSSITLLVAGMLGAAAFMRARKQG